jgi:phosphoribosylglycinamide formyltransferase-1
MHSIVIFASGRGSNARAIIDHFKTNGNARVALIVSNKADAGVIAIAEEERIPFLVVDKKTIGETLLVEQLMEYHPSLLVLAGFLWKIPDSLLKAFSGKIINIHPALLPLYGGKGMYGHHVHKAVLNANDAESGITIHHVNEVYDSGNIILQARCPVDAGDTADSLADRIHKLEHFYYPRVIEYLLGQ